MIKIRLKPGLKKRWLQALKGNEYRKARDMLYNPNSQGHCCLGVLCNLTGKDDEDMDNVGLIGYTDFKRVLEPVDDRQTDRFALMQEDLAKINDETAGWDKAIAYIKERFV